MYSGSITIKKIKETFLRSLKHIDKNIEFYKLENFLIKTTENWIPLNKSKKTPQAFKERAKAYIEDLEKEKVIKN